MPAFLADFLLESGRKATAAASTIKQSNMLATLGAITMGHETLAMKELEAAINRLRERAPGDGVILVPGVEQLADLYGRMIWFHLASVSTASLTADEVAALTAAA